jgi:hypothetical protein
MNTIAFQELRRAINARKNNQPYSINTRQKDSQQYNIRASNLEKARQRRNRGCTSCGTNRLRRLR